VEQQPDHHTRQHSRERRRHGEEHHRPHRSTDRTDHTDRAVEVHGVAWSKQSAPDVLGDVAWPLGEIEHELDRFTLKAWVRDRLLGARDELRRRGHQARVRRRGLSARG
jgi:hypothetical protein